jgi:hypothetical protein
VRAFPSPGNTNFWHVDTYRAGDAAYCGTYCLWCGSDSLWTDGNPVDCGNWSPGKAPGYGNQWNCIAQLALPDTFYVANGCTLCFDPRYDTECKYDYLYVEFFDGSEWQTLAKFNASSDNPGDPCGNPSTPNPDYWGNTDTGQPNFADWQTRPVPGVPAFYRVLTPDTLVVTSGPKFRWRFTSDGAWSDQDGRGNTDGAAFIDNVWVWGDHSWERYEEDFESGVLDTAYWSLPNAPGILDAWHINHDADPPDEALYSTCINDSSFAYRARPEQGYKAGEPWRNKWYYRLMSPKFELQNSGCVVQYDWHWCFYEYTCDWPSLQVRFYNTQYDRWCPWYNAFGMPISKGCYSWWFFDDNEDISPYYSSATAESAQFAWDIMDVSQSGDFCEGKHTKTDFQVDNVSIGFYDRSTTWFSARSIDMLHDTFHDNLCGFNSLFRAWNQDTVDRYSGPPYDDTPLRRHYQLYVDISDPDGLTSVALYGSVDEGASWVSVPMTLDGPPEYGEYYGTLCPDDFGLDMWETGTEVWYHLLATDELSNEEYWPASADPTHPIHSGDRGDHFTFSILPMYPETYTGPKVLLVDGYNRQNYNYAECVSSVDQYRYLEEIYEETLTDAGYCYDIYDIGGAGSNVHIHPVWFDDYDCVVWFTGPYFSNYLFDKQAQQALRDYLGAGGKVVLCGDRIAYNMAVVGEDSLGGDFLEGIMGCDYLSEMESAYDRPYLYAVGADSVEVFGVPAAVGLDTLLVYRECPYLKDMSYVAVIDSPPTGYTAQRLMYLADIPAGDRDGVIYTEYQGVGQCAYVNFDLCASANHVRGYCSGLSAEPAPDFTAGTYEGRVELMRVILEDIFGLPAGGGGPASVEPPLTGYRWALAQNTPNPCIGATRIRYEIGRSARVRIKIYNALGREVCVLVDGAKGPGVHSADWDGRNSKGERVTSGVYFYKMEADAFTATRKMLVLK